MATTTPTRSSIRTPRSGPAPLFGLFVILWVLFVAALIFNPGALNTVWQWLTGLPLVLEVIVWVLFLPLTFSLWIWELDWALWLRLLLVIVIGVGNLAAFSPRNRQRSRSIPSDPGADLHEIPRGAMDA